MGDEVFILAIVGTAVGGLIAITAIVTHTIRRAREEGYAARLKQDMIQRGFTADDIERIIRVTPPSENDRDWEHIKDFTGRRT